MAKSYTIKDKNELTWGSFSIVSEKFGNIHGYLKPTTEFSEYVMYF